MHFLYECGQCGALNQLDTSLLSSDLVVCQCRECKTQNTFGLKKQDGVEKPSIETVVQENKGNVTSPESVEPLSIQWRCGVCESSYQFDATDISMQGSKLTCSTCFNFIMLMPMNASQDVPPLIIPNQKKQTTSEGDAEQPAESPPAKEDAPVYEDKTNVVQENEVIEVYNPHNPLTNDPPSQPVIKAGYADPRKPKSPPSSTAYIKAPKTEISMPEVKEPSQDPDPVQKGLPNTRASMSNDDIDAMFLNTDETNKSVPDEDPPQESPSPKQQPEQQPAPNATQPTPTPQETKSPHASNEKLDEISQAYMNPDSSFIAYKEFKEDQTFTYNFDEKDLKEVDPEADIPKPIKSIEKYMVKFSLIGSLVMILMFAGFYVYRSHQSKKMEAKREALQQQQEEELKKAKEAQPKKFGFPEMAPAEDTP